MINKENKTTEVWKLFYDLCKELPSVTITGSKDIKIKNYVAAYPESMLDTKSNYPIIVVNSPEFDGRHITLDTREYTGRIEINILTNQSESADKFKDLLMSKIDNNTQDFLSNGLYDVELTDSFSTHYDRGQIKIHDRRLSWRFNI